MATKVCVLEPAKGRCDQAVNTDPSLASVRSSYRVSHNGRENVSRHSLRAAVSRTQAANRDQALPSREWISNRKVVGSSLSGRSLPFTAYGYIRYAISVNLFIEV